MAKLSLSKIVCTVCLSCAVMTAPTFAQTFTTLANFNGTDGEFPTLMSLTQGLDGNYYGVTLAGGSTLIYNPNQCQNGCGTIFKITPVGTLTTLYNFNGGGYGGYPEASLLQATDGSLYGTSTGAGTGATATVFKITPAGALTTLYSFAGASDGDSPLVPLVQTIDGTFYGTTQFAGANGNGTVFKITPGGTLTALYSFCHQTSCADGTQPTGVLAQGTDGNFYGTTVFGGANGFGTVFRITPGGTLTTLHSFNATDGEYPWAGLLQGTDGNFYGTTTGAGANNFPGCVVNGTVALGTVFKITPGGTLTTLHSFSGADGFWPIAGLVQATNGNFYGTAGCGGANKHGTIFEITPAGTLTTLHDFDGITDGSTPYAGLVQGTDGKLYGTATEGGANGYGTVFSVNVGLAPFVEVLPNSGAVGETVTILGNSLTGATGVSFNGTAASFTVISSSEIQTTVPAGATTGLVQVTTPNGALNSNAAFLIIATAPQAATPYFSPAPGTYSAASVALGDITPGAVIYYTTNGTTPTTASTVYTGPIAVNSTETIEAIAAAGGYSNSAVAIATYTIDALLPPAASPSFSIASGTYPPPLTVTISDATAGATIYYTTDGTTPTTSSAQYTGGIPLNVNSTETIEAIAIASGHSTSTVATATYTIASTPALTTLVTFNTANGASPSLSMSLIQGTDGNLYGTTVAGGANGNISNCASFGCGTVFKVTPAGALTTLYSFCAQTGCADGAQPYAGVVQGKDGNFYGTTQGGGAVSSGTVFKITAGGALTTLHSFVGTEGISPWAGLVQGTDGNFYGTTSQGGTNGQGTVFKITPSGALTRLYNFCAQGGSACTDGAEPLAGLVQATDGNFYGTTYGGGASGRGTVFRITPGGTLTTLYSFCPQTGCADGSRPQAGLTQGADGNFYGAAGTVFKITPAGTLTTLHSFNGTDGSGPNGLVQATDGNFYGTTNQGGANNTGTVFKLTSGGTLTTLHSFLSSGTDGASPNGLVQATDGNLYGTTSSGGGYSVGTLFSLNAGLGQFQGKKTAPGDFDGDHKSDVAVWRPATGTWYVIPSSAPSTFTATQWGVSGDTPVPGDYDGDGKTDMAVWRSATGTWYVIPSSAPSTFTATQWGVSGDTPVPGDYDGDGKTDMAVWRPSNGTWYIIPTSAPTTFTATQWGINGDVPVPGDYDGDGKIDKAVWRPSTGTWYILPSSKPGTFIAVQWGMNGDVPVPGDYDGDGKTDIAVWRPTTGTWYVIPSSAPSTFTATQWGVNGDIPVPGDYDGDGKIDMAVWRPSIGTWFIIPTSAPNTFRATQWGINGDVPIQKPIGQ